MWETLGCIGGRTELQDVPRDLYVDALAHVMLAWSCVSSF